MQPRRGRRFFWTQKDQGFSPEREPGFDGYLGKPVVEGPSMGDYLRLNDRSSLATSGLWPLICDLGSGMSVPE